MKRVRYRKLSVGKNVSSIGSSYLRTYIVGNRINTAGRKSIYLNMDPELFTNSKYFPMIPDTPLQNQHPAIVLLLPWRGGTANLSTVCLSETHVLNYDIASPCLTSQQYCSVELLGYCTTNLVLLVWPQEVDGAIKL